MNFYFKLFYVLFFFPTAIIAQDKSGFDNEIISLIDAINTKPIEISIKNTLQINNQGGHLQGIQYVNYQEKDYYFLSGSSDTYSYYSVVEIGDNNSVLSVNKILDSPFKHAGGFQINNNIMAIGIEDNTKKNRSKVFVYQIDNPEKLPKTPLKIINRSGAVKRATAGCVAITEIKDQILVLVGDWDTKHLDFYTINKEELNKNKTSFKLEYSIDSEKADKSEWIDKNFLSYQNINFVQDTSGRLYLAGMTTNQLGENILDLFRIEIDKEIKYKLIKVFSRKFKNSNSSSFRWGAGIHLSNNKKIKILTSGKQLQKQSKIHVYE